MKTKAKVRQFSRYVKLDRNKKLAVHLARGQLEPSENNDNQVGIVSGFSYDKERPHHYLYLDYDDNYESEEWRWIVREYGLKRALIIESSEGKYWFVSFTPLPIGEIAEIMYFSHCDKRHAQFFFKDGFVALRLNSKEDSSDYPRVIKTFKNPKGTNFYNFNYEKAYRKILKEGVDREWLKGLDISRLIKRQKELIGNG